MGDLVPSLANNGKECHFFFSVLFFYNEALMIQKKFRLLLLIVIWSAVNPGVSQMIKHYEQGFSNSSGLVQSQWSMFPSHAFLIQGVSQYLGVIETGWVPDNREAFQLQGSYQGFRLGLGYTGYGDNLSSVQTSLGSIYEILFGYYSKISDNVTLGFAWKQGLWNFDFYEDQKYRINNSSLGMGAAYLWQGYQFYFSWDVLNLFPDEFSSLKENYCLPEDGYGELTCIPEKNIFSLVIAPIDNVGFYMLLSNNFEGMLKYDFGNSFLQMLFPLNEYFWIDTERYTFVGLGLDLNQNAFGLQLVANLAHDSWSGGDFEWGSVYRFGFELSYTFNN